MQDLLGVSEPDFGVLLDDMFVEDGDEIALETLLQGDVVATAAGGAVLGHPAAAVAWLVNKIPPGDWPLEPGALVLSGGLTAPVPMRPGSVVSAEFDRLGAIEVFS